MKLVIGDCIFDVTLALLHFSGFFLFSPFFIRGYFRRFFAIWLAVETTAFRANKNERKKVGKYSTFRRKNFARL